MFIKSIFLYVFIFMHSPVFGYSDNYKIPDNHLTKLSKEIAKEINIARKDPQKYVLILEEFKNKYDGKSLKLLNKKIITTKEGTRVVDEAIKFLNKISSMPPLKFSSGMSKGARDHINDISSTNITGHKGKDKSLPGIRINRLGEWKLAVGENICYGFNTAREILIWMIVDDGFPTRGHRINIYRSDFRFVGVALQEHPLYEFICVITFAGEYLDTNN